MLQDTDAGVVQGQVWVGPAVGRRTVEQVEGASQRSEDQPANHGPCRCYFYSVRDETPTTVYTASVMHQSLHMQLSSTW